MTSLLQWVSRNRVWLILVALGALLFFSLQTSASDVAPGELEALVTRGQPTVLEMYSNF